MQTATKELERLRDQRAAAEYLGVSPRFLEGRRLRGGGPKYLKLGSSLRARVRYRQADLDAWLEANSRTFTGEQRVAL